MKKGIIYYSLYTNKEQDNLIAMAYSEEGLKELCNENTEGVLFEYDVEQKEGHLDILLNERPYKGNMKLGKKVKPKKAKKEDNEGELMLNSEMGDLR